MKQENRVQVIAAAQVFVGGACYGANATMFKTAFAQGFTWPQVVACQMWSAAALFALAVVVRRTQGNRWEKLGKKSCLNWRGLDVSPALRASFTASLCRACPLP